VDGKNCVIAEKNGWLTMINFGWCNMPSLLYHTCY
jgi:hypothetical protein